MYVHDWIIKSHFLHFQKHWRGNFFIILLQNYRKQQLFVKLSINWFILIVENNLDVWKLQEINFI